MYAGYDKSMEKVEYENKALNGRRVSKKIIVLANKKKLSLEYASMLQKDMLILIHIWKFFICSPYIKVKIWHRREEVENNSSTDEQT